MVVPNTHEAYERASESFIARNPKSKAIYERATESLPGGNTRSSVFYHPFPVSVNRAEGARLYDEDGHEYVDMLGEYTAGLYGHSEPVILDAISEALHRGLNFGSHHGDEGKLAALLRDRFWSIDLLRFTNSGTEATLMALAAATAYTGKKKILVFSGAYHGGAFLFRDGKNNVVNAPYEYLIAKYNDLSSVQALLHSTENEGQVAAIIIEPMQGSGGAIPAKLEFLEGLRKAATDSNAVLIFDEVMTSRMYEGGGIQSQLPQDCRPDMTTLGKYIGGGMSFGAFGGKRAIMEMFDPRNPKGLIHAGTFNNNVLTMAAGRAGLSQIFTPKRALELHTRGDKLRTTIQEVTKGTLLKITGVGSIMCFHFTKTEVDEIRSYEDVKDHNYDLGSILHLFMLERGYYVGSRGFIALCLPLSDEDLEGFVDTIREFLHSYKTLVSGEMGSITMNGH